MLPMFPSLGEFRSRGSKLWQIILASLVFLAVAPVRAGNPSSGTITDSNTTLTYTAGPFDVPNLTDSATGTPTCSATIPAEQCDTFALTVNVAPGDATTKQISVSISFANSAGEFDLFVFDSNNNLIASDTAGGEPSAVIIPAVSGTYSIVVDPWNPLGQSFVGTVALQTIPSRASAASRDSSAIYHLSCPTECRAEPMLRASLPSELITIPTSPASSMAP